MQYAHQQKQNIHSFLILCITIDGTIAQPKPKEKTIKSQRQI